MKSPTTCMLDIPKYMSTDIGRDKTMYKDENPQTAAIMSIGMKALREALGTIDTELFLVTVKSTRFDYTEWRRDNLWIGMTAEEILDKAAKKDQIGVSFGLDNDAEA